MSAAKLIACIAQVQIEPGFTECWVWCGRYNRNGYGRLGNGKMAHREMYEELVGPIPDGHLLDHKCRVRGCTNPDHTEPVTHQVNTLRGEAKLFGRDIHPQYYIKKTLLP